jgi:DNA-binding CsgD family transcriptional regulator
MLDAGKHRSSLLPQASRMDPPSERAFAAQPCEMRVDVYDVAVRHLIEECHSTRSWNDLERLMSQLQVLLPHRYFGCAVQGAKSLLVRHVFNLNVPELLWGSLVLDPAAASTGHAREWLASREPTFYQLPAAHGDHHDAAQSGGGGPADWVLLHGIPDLSGSYICFFYFVGSERLATRDVRRALITFSPHLYLAISNFVRAPSAAMGREALSVRETEVLQLVAIGKTNEEIAHVLKISHFTVKNHMQSILLKLYANNRTHAVIRAIEQGLLTRDPNCLVR